MEEDRLVRIENKLDKLSDAVVAIARTEEQITTLFAKNTETRTRLDTCESDIKILRERSHNITNAMVEHGARIHSLEGTKELVEDMRIDVHDNSKSLARIEKLTWLAVGGVASIAVYLIERLIEGILP